jgi:hypothetical protein
MSELFNEVYEVYADLEDLNDEDLIKLRPVIKQRLELALNLIKEL